MQHPGSSRFGLTLPARVFAEIASRTYALTLGESSPGPGGFPTRSAIVGLDKWELSGVRTGHMASRLIEDGQVLAQEPQPQGGLLGVQALALDLGHAPELVAGVPFQAPGDEGALDREQQPAQQADPLARGSRSLAQRVVSLSASRKRAIARLPSRTCMS